MLDMLPNSTGKNWQEIHSGGSDVPNPQHRRVIVGRHFVSYFQLYTIWRHLEQVPEPRTPLRSGLYKSANFSSFMNPH
ncbi:hypothetical protein CGCF413_v012562 [Colletotrichum fructicola]|nr:hypothetical protein CGCF413_v012562 [Colletotrichum fructicola]